MLVGLTVAVRPADALVVRATVPVNPLTGATVIVAVAEDPAFTVRLVVLVVIAAVVFGSALLPKVASQASRALRELRRR